MKNNLTKKEIAEALSEMPSIGLPVSTVEKVLNGLIVIVRNGLAAGRGVKIQGLISAEIVERKARTGFNPRTKEAINIAAKRTVVVRASKELKQAVNA
jgi:DNA-binding protein HU-beta